MARAAAALVAVVLPACAGHSGAPTAQMHAAAGSFAPEWLLRQPHGCAIGQSGPTMKPTDALREARRRARAALVTALGRVRTRSVAVTRGTAAGTAEREVLLEESEGWVRQASTVGLWYDADGVGPSKAAGTAYAAVCFPGNDPGTAEWTKKMEAARAAPAWIYGGKPDGARLCAVGVSGPTMVAGDARKNAEDAAREQLAEAIAVKVKSATAIFDGNEVLFGAVTEVPEECRHKARAASVAESWIDEKGSGPIPFSGTSYALVCEAN